MTDMDHCLECGKHIPIKQGEPYALIWGPREQPVTVLGVLCIPCSNDPKYNDITAEVTGRKDVSPG